MMRLAAALVLALCLLPGLAADVAAQLAAGRRVALVIGNAAYLDMPLRNPINDARAMADVLKQRGFEVILRENTSKLDLERAVADFGEKLQQGATGLFYYAGHGMQVNGRNFLIPVDAQIPSEQRVRLESVDVDLVLEQMQAARSAVNLVILDACRNNPFERRFRSGGGGGLAQINAPEGTLIAYATAPGSVAADGTSRHSLYTEELLKAMQVPGAKVEEVFKAVRVAVSRRSNGAQTPWEASSLTGDFFFVPTVAARAEPPAVAPGPAQPSASAGPSRAAMELAFWESVKGSSNPAELEAYLAQFPEGTFVTLAKARIAALATPAPASTPTSPPPQQQAALPPAAASPPRVQSSPAEQGFPRRPITLVVPFPPGANSDAVARWIAGPMANTLRQPVIVENKPGAGGNIGAQHVLGVARDGYTVFVGSSTTLALNQAVQTGMVDPASFAALGGIYQTSLLLTVPRSLPARNVQELVAYLKVNRQQANYASVGAGTASAVLGAAFNAATGIGATNIPYLATQPALADIVAGRAAFFFAEGAVAASQAAAGGVRVLANASAQRSDQWPDVPTLAEAGVAGLDATLWSGLFVPQGVAPETMLILSRALAEALRDPALADRMRSIGLSAMPLTATAMDARLMYDRNQWQALVSRAASR